MNTPPQTLGKYQIIREIARSNDIVYEAYDPAMNRRVAIKELAMPSGSSPVQQEERIKRFMREARAVGSLTHPNIMTVFEVGQEGDRYYIAMEYLDGHTLRNEIDTKGFLPVDRSVEITQEVLAGLGYAHEKGVIHRDIKPDNIQILSTGKVKITDFGIARLTFEPNLTMDGQVFGTPSYMSPEQVVGKEIDARSDLFSVGVMLYEMVAGSKPFAGDSVVSITYAIMNKEPQRPQQVEVGLWNVIAKSLDKTPGMRYPSAEAMAKAITEGMKPAVMPYDSDPTILPSNTTYTYGQSLYPANAYSQPPMTPPPVVNPYLPNVTPYTPSVGTPYQAPLGVPYQPPQPQGYNQVTGFGTNQTQVPIYYPPPPRKMAFSPEARYTIGRVLIGLFAVGAVFGSLFMVVKYASSYTAPNSKAPAQQAPSSAQDMPRDQQIRLLESQLNETKDVDQIARENATLAQLYEEEAADLHSLNDVTGEESNLLNSLKHDPNRSSACVSLASLYDQRAKVEPDLGERKKVLERAANYWQRASTIEKDSLSNGQYAENSCLSLVELAKVLAQLGDKTEARKQLYAAMAIAPAGSRGKQVASEYLIVLGG
ncbi:MAG: protein kinase [Armatimonadetes bacterium]|nr:protein kinase [Armatimonadota bacterium]